MKKGINWKLRIKNPYFWLGLGGAIIAASGISPESITSWSMIGKVLLDFISNPFAVVSVIVTIVGVILDPTTAGVSDSQRALSYNTLKDSDIQYGEEEIDCTEITEESSSEE